MKGLGSDIIEVERIAKGYTRYGQRFLDKMFTPKEQAYCLTYREPAERLAGRFAAKEAVAKALGMGFRGPISWLDIEIQHDSYGKPLVVLAPHLVQLFENPTLHITISHCKSYAMAVVVWAA